MRRYNLFQPLYLSFYSGDVYADVAHNWRGHTFVYLILLLAINWIPRSLDISERVNAWVVDEAPHLIAQIPPITISDGKASIAGGGPVYVKDRADSLFMIIDMTGQHTTLSSSGAMVLLTESALSIQNGPSDEDIQTQAIPANEHTVITRETLQTFVLLVNALIGYGFYPLAIAGSFVFYLLKAVIFAVFVARFSAGRHEPLPRRTLVDLAIVAFTPAVLLDTVHDLIDAPLETWLWWPMSMFLSIGYLFFAIEEAGPGRMKAEG